MDPRRPLPVLELRGDAGRRPAWLAASPADADLSNQLARGGGTGELPVGAASVKEMYDDAGRITGYGAKRKVEAGGAAGWYWYERLRDRDPNADGMNEGSCPG